VHATTLALLCLVGAMVAFFPRAIVRSLAWILRPVGGPRALRSEELATKLVRIIAAVLAVSAGVQLLLEVT